MIEDIFIKVFEVNGIPIICRGDYESLPLPMCSTDLDDIKMCDLANNIYCELTTFYSFDKGCVENYFTNPKHLKEIDDELYEDIDRAFWYEMEVCAVNLGMRYYEDIPQ